MKKRIIAWTAALCLLSAGWAVAGQEPIRRPDALGNGIVTQIGIVVKDIEKTSLAFAEVLGVSATPWEMTDPEVKAHTIFRGQPSPAQAKLAFIDMSNIIIELIEPVGGPSTWKEFLDKHGEGVHHIAFEVVNMDERLAELAFKGVPLIQSGDYTGGRYTYVDATAKLGLILELLENR